MYSKKDFGFSADFLKTVASVMSKNRNMTVSEIQEKLNSGVWSADTPILEGKEALIYDRQLNRRISVNVISEAMDPVNKKALKKDFDDRKDKDIDNDGDIDDSDEYLHNRRKAVSKAMKDEASCGTKRMKEDEDLEEGKKGYKKESEDSSNDEKMTDAQKNDMDGDGEKDKKDKKKKNGDREKVDTVDTDPEMSDTMMQERTNKKLASYEREKLDDLKKKHEGGKMHRALRRQYGDRGDEIFYGKLTKMAKGEYDGSQSKSEEFQLTAEDLNALDELQRLGQEWELEEAIHIEKGKKISPKQADKFLRSINARGVTRYFDLRSTEVNDLIDFGKKNGHLGGMGILKDGPKYLEYLNSLADKGTKKEDVDLDEARGRPPKGDDADDGGSKNFIMQMRKSVSLRGQNTVTFDDGSKMKVDQKKAQAFLSKFGSLKKPAEKEALMKSASKSPKHLDMAIQGKVAKDKNFLMLPPLKSEE